MRGGSVYVSRKHGTCRSFAFLEMKWGDVRLWIGLTKLIHNWKKSYLLQLLRLQKSHRLKKY